MPIIDYCLSGLDPLDEVVRFQTLQLREKQETLKLLKSIWGIFRIIVLPCYSYLRVGSDTQTVYVILDY